MKSKWRRITTLQEIDAHLISSEYYYYLEKDDACYFYDVFIAGGKKDKGFPNSINNLINNFKKSPTQQGEAHYHYKKKATKEISDILIHLKEWNKLKNFTWVPVPPHLHRADKYFDTRLFDVLNLIKKEMSLDVKDLVQIKETRTPVHIAHRVNESRIKPEDHYNNYEINKQLIDPIPSNIVIFDDLIVTGAGFKAMKQILSEIYPNAKIIGVFIARYIHEDKGF